MIARKGETGYGAIWHGAGCPGRRNYTQEESRRLELTVKLTVLIASRGSEAGAVAATKALLQKIVRYGKEESNV